MKKARVYLFGLFVIGILISGCSGGQDDIPIVSSSALGQTLTISNQQVWTQSFNFGLDITGDTDWENIKWSDLKLDAIGIVDAKYTGEDLNVSDNFVSAGGSGSILNGKLTYSIGPLSDEILGPLSEVDFTDVSDFNIYSDFLINPPDALGAVLTLIIDSAGTLQYAKNSLATNFFSVNIATHIGAYIFVNKDVTIRASGSKNNDIEGVIVNTNSINLKLKQGWNIINSNVSASVNLIGLLEFLLDEKEPALEDLPDLIKSLNSVVDVSVSTDYPPGAKWIMSEPRDFSYWDLGEE